MKVLMVCLGNICRSPMAEGVFRYKALENGVDMFVDSCGTANYHVGEHPHHLSIKISKKHGIDISHLVGRQFSSNDFDKFDVILTMDRSNYHNVINMAGNGEQKSKVKMILNYSFPNSNMNVPDPWYGEEPGYEEVFQLLNQAADEFFNQYFDE